VRTVPRAMRRRISRRADAQRRELRFVTLGIHSSHRVFEPIGLSRHLRSWRFPNLEAGSGSRRYLQVVMRVGSPAVIFVLLSSRRYFS
jgi:hypothetical protein